MTVGPEMIRMPGEYYFAGKMPGELEAYLYDRYGEEPLAGDLAPLFFWPAVFSDMDAYCKGELDTKVRTPMEKLEERYAELSSILGEYAERNCIQEMEMEYLYDYIRWRGLESEFQYFLRNARKEPYEGGPFTHYVL